MMRLNVLLVIKKTKNDLVLSDIEINNVFSGFAD